MLRLGILISGGGTTMSILQKTIKAGHLDAEICTVVSSSRKAAGVQRAEALGLPCTVITRATFDSDEAFSDSINAQMLRAKVDLVVMGGFLKRYLPGPQFRNRCINIHPSLIPAFSGHGFYGMRVHESVYRRGCTVSGCTIHFVDDQYDEGPIIYQQAVSLSLDDGPEQIQAKVFEAECEAYPKVIQWFAEKRVGLESGRVSIKPR